MELPFVINGGVLSFARGMFPRCRGNSPYEYRGISGPVMLPSIDGISIARRWVVSGMSLSALLIRAV